MNLNEHLQEIKEELNKLLFAQKELIRKMIIKSGWLIADIMLIILGCMSGLNWLIIIGSMTTSAQGILLLNLIYQYRECKQMIKAGNALINMVEEQD